MDRRGRDPLIAVVADHGEAFKERGVFGHAWDLHREVLDIPFLIHRPGQTEGHRVALPVQQADLLPTLIELRRPGRAPSRQLFDWVEDPEERHDLAGERPILAGRMARLLREQLELSGRDGVPAPEVEVDEDTRRRLQALGYIE